MALGVTWGIGTLILLFYNGVVLGAVIFDYVRAGQSVFLMGWLLPHGVIEIPAILIAGQAGLLLGQALIGWNSKENLAQRLRSVTGSLVTLISGAALLLIWAGLVEAFFSQYHEPILPYQFKIIFGLFEFAGAPHVPFCTCSKQSSSARKVVSFQSWCAGHPCNLVAFQVSGKSRLKFVSGNSQMRTNTLVILTPEGISFTQHLAGPVTRFLAFAIDLAGITLVSGILSQVLLLAAMVSPDFALAARTICYFVVTIGYSMLLEWTWRGQTLGKRVLKIRVVDAEGFRLTPDANRDQEPFASHGSLAGLLRE